MTEHLTDRFARIQPVYSALEEEIHRLFAPLLHDPELKIHSVSSRIKAIESLRRKAARPDRTYTQLSDLTDLLGFRIISYFEDGVGHAARFVERHLQLDLARSVDKRKQESLDRFGYRSLHYVCWPPEGFFLRHGFEPDPGLRFEIQIRTILQHAWAEIEHDLGYKTTSAIPAPIRRRFSRLAGLLELADEEFLTIKAELARYEADVAQRIHEHASGVDLDEPSLRAFAQDHPGLAALDRDIAAALALPLTDEPFFPAYLVRALRLVGLHHIDELEALLVARHARILAFIGPYFRFTRRAFALTPETVGHVQPGYGLLFLAHLLLIESAALDVELKEAAERFYTALDYPRDPDTAARVAVCFVETIRESL